MAWPKFTVGVYSEVPEILIECFSKLHIALPLECIGLTQY